MGCLTFDIVVAIEPFAYREVLASALPHRPKLRILTVDLDTLESTVAGLSPCSTSALG